MNEMKLKYDDYYEGYFAFLDELKESGVTNMFGAVPYLMDEFILDKISYDKITSG